MSILGRIDDRRLRAARNRVNVYEIMPVLEEEKVIGIVSYEELVLRGL